MTAMTAMSMTGECGQRKEQSSRYGADERELAKHFPFALSAPAPGSLNVRYIRKFRSALTIEHLLGPIFAAQLAVRGSGLAVGVGLICKNLAVPLK
jgi:hypothetical protein